MLFELANSLRSLTSPLTAALHEAHKMTRPFHFEQGGTVPHEGRVEDRHNEEDFLLPPDVDPMLVALAIDAKLHAGRTAPGIGDDPMMLLERRVGGRIAVPAPRLLRLGDGRYDRGRQFMHGLIAQLRRRRH
jgi:hypothetical protein